MRVKAFARDFLLPPEERNSIEKKEPDIELRSILQTCFVERKKPGS
jgi:hypothetical protein